MGQYLCLFMLKTIEISFTLIVRTSKLSILLFLASIETIWQNSDRQNSEMLLRIHVQLIAIEFALDLDSYKTCKKYIYLINNNLKNDKITFDIVIIFFSLFTFRKLVNSHNNHTE